MEHSQMLEGFPVGRENLFRIYKIKNLLLTIKWINYLKKQCPGGSSQIKRIEVFVIPFMGGGGVYKKQFRFSLKEVHSWTGDICNHWF